MSNTKTEPAIIEGYELRVTAMAVSLPGKPTFDLHTTTLTIADEGGGEYVEVEQQEGGKVAITAEEWPALRSAIDQLLEHCRA